MPPDPLRSDPVRVLVVDDEPAARAGTRAILGQRPEVAVIGEAVDGLEALQAIERLQPQLLFLDVQMPGLDGFGVLQGLEPDKRPAVVFVTAYEQYALRAFEAHALDYLLKPFDEARLLKALERALQWLARAPAPDARVDALLADHRRDRVVVRDGGRLRMIAAAEITWIEARGNYVHLHAPGGPFLLRETLNALARTLAPERFARVHRSAVVATQEVLAMERQPSGDYELLLRSKERVPLGRSYRDAFVQRWKGLQGSA